MSKKEAIDRTAKEAAEKDAVWSSSTHNTCEYHLRAVAKEPHLAECTSRCPEGLAQPRWTKVRDAGFKSFTTDHIKTWSRSPKWIKFSLGFLTRVERAGGREEDSLLMTSGRGNFSTSDFAEAFKASTQDPGQGASTDTRRLSLLTAASFLKLRFHTECSGSRTVHLQGL